MRIRISIDRNELPVTSLAWCIPPDCTAAQFLATLDNVVPLTSDIWSLEDYVVEVPGKRLFFEILHYEILNMVLNEEDEILIRPLSTSELKERRISGRHQISWDGRHLLDGVPFGKRLTRRLDRPAVKIPPRRRSPFELDNRDDDDGSPEHDGGMALDAYESDRPNRGGDRQLFLDADLGEDDSEDNDFEPTRDQDDEEDSGSEEETDADEDMLNNEDGDQDGKHKRHSRASFPRPTKRKAPPHEHGIGMLIGDTAHSDGSDIEEDESEDDMDPLLGYYDHHGLPKGSIDSGKALHHMAGILTNSTSRTSKLHKWHAADQKRVRFTADTPRDELSSTSSSDVESEAEEDEDEEGDDASSNCTSSASEESHSADDSEASLSNSSNDSESAESSNDSSSDDDSAPEEESSKAIPEEPKASGLSVIKHLMDASQLSVAPGKGRKATKARNARRRNAQAFLRMQEKGILPDDITAAEFSKLHLNASTTKEEATAALDALRSARLAETDPDFAARRKRLLESLESGGIEVGPVSSEAEAVQDSIPEAPEQSNPSTPAEPTEGAAPPRRAKLDLGAGRRLLFGALGIKNPKTKRDEEKLRKDLMKDVRPLITPKPDSSEPTGNADDEDEDPEAWRNTIVYRAVECCQDDVQLSEPPFPFVQRWDPQQQGGRSKYGGQSSKRKKGPRDDLQYDGSSQPSKKQKLRKARHGYAEEQEYLDGSYEPSYEEDLSALDYGDNERESELLANAAETGVISETQNGSDEADEAGNSQEPADLAPLPDDPATLPDLLADQVTTGMTIAFKQLVMSEATKWQPQISAYRTAIVIANPGDGMLHLTLALRDRKQPELNYDEETGDRIYGKFDMPIDEDDEEFEDDGMLNLQFGELVEPKVVQNAPDSLIIGNDIPDATTTGSANHDEQSASQRKGDVEEQFSHITETPLQSEIPESHSPPWSIDQEGQGSIDHHESGRLPDSANANLKDRPVRVMATTESAPDEGEAISDEAREEISLLMKEDGFRSSVPSSIQRDTHLNHITSPGDTAIFETLMNDLTETEDQFPSSPKFHGFGSTSPIRQSEAHESSDESQLHFSSPAPPESSWQTIPFDEPSSLPSELQAEIIRREPLDMLGDSSEAMNSSAPATKPTKPKSKRKLHKAPPIQRANELWEQLSHQKAQSTNGATSADNVHGPSEQPLDLGSGSVGERVGNVSIRYQKLSVGSSFTSQISDHGRQPDAVFEDSTTLEGDIAKPSAGDSSATHNSHMEPLDDLLFDTEPNRPSHSNDNVQTAKGKALEMPRALSSDLPPIDVVPSQRTAQTSMNLAADGNEDSQEPGAIASLREPNHSTPKASRNAVRTPKRSASRPNPQTRSKGPGNSQTPASQKNFVVPEGSQVMDLTLSSDGEVDPDSLDAYMPPFRRYTLGEDDDEAYKEGAADAGKGGGWVKKKASSQTDSPRHTGKRLRSSSQASSTPRSTRKKKGAKF